MIGIHGEMSGVQMREKGDGQISSFRISRTALPITYICNAAILACSRSLYVDGGVGVSLPGGRDSCLFSLGNLILNVH